jgi:hypothetical protein
MSTPLTHDSTGGQGVAGSNPVVPTVSGAPPISPKGQVSGASCCHGMITSVINSRPTLGTIWGPSRRRTPPTPQTAPSRRTGRRRRSAHQASPQAMATQQPTFRANVDRIPPGRTQVQPACGHLPARIGRLTGHQTGIVPDLSRKDINAGGSQ